MGMKKYLLLSTLVSAGSLFIALTVGAQSKEFEDKEAPSSSMPAESTPSPGDATVATAPSGQQQTLVSSATMVGIGIKNSQGETIGDIQEIMIDPETGKVA